MMKIPVTGLETTTPPDQNGKAMPKAVYPAELGFN